MRIIAVIALAWLLSACAQQSQVQLYPGAELPSSRVLTVQVPSALEVIDVNGSEVASVNSMFSGEMRELKLEPGEYRINAFYKNVFDIGGGMSSEVVRSRSAVFLVNGQPGETWRLDFPRPDTLQEARRLEDSFSGWSVNIATGERIASETGSRAQSSLDQLLGKPSTAPAVDTAVAPLRPTTPNAASAAASVAPASQATLPHNEATLATLQQLWQMLSPESREAFLEWARQ